MWEKSTATPALKLGATYRNRCDSECRTAPGRHNTFTDAARLDAMGFNPHRKFRPRPLDVVLVIVTLLATAGLLAWALLG